MGALALANRKSVIGHHGSEPGPLPFRTGEPISYPAGPHWFAVYTNIKCEARAQLSLDAQGFRTFLPQMTKWVSHARVRTVVKRPLLCRYLFVEIDPNKQGFDAVRRTDGVESIVGNCGTPMVIPSGFVVAFLKKQLAGEFDYAAKEPITRGAKVKIVTGEWDELIGMVTGGSTANGGAVMVQLLNRRTMVRMRAHGVRAVVRR